MKGRPNYIAWSGTGLILLFTAISSLTSLHYLHQIEHAQLSTTTSPEQLPQESPIQNTDMGDSQANHPLEITAGFRKAIAFQLCMGVVVSLLVYLLVVKFVTQPLIKSKAAVDILASGEIGFQLETNSPTEIGDLNISLRQANIAIHQFEGELKKFAIALQKKQFNYRINQNEYSGFYRNILKRLNQGMQSVEILSSQKPKIQTSIGAEHNTLKNMVDSLQSEQQNNDKLNGFEPAIDEIALQSLLNSLQGLISETDLENKSNHPEKQRHLEQVPSDEVE